MPNIEVHGIDESTFDTVTRFSLKKAFATAEYANEIVVSHGSASSKNLRGQRTPFLRICATKTALDEHLADMVKRLKTVTKGIEILELRDFIEVK
jgi:hypothetical protein